MLDCAVVFGIIALAATSYYSVKAIHADPKNIGRIIELIGECDYDTSVD